jgi:hypothetical protein
VKLLKKTIFYTIIIYALLTSRSAIGNEMKLSEHDAYLLIDRLLTLSEESSNHKVQFERYKKWEELYIKFSNNEDMTKNKMKIYLFMTFIAHEKTMIHPQEEIAEGIVPIFTRQPEMMLSVLKELPFLMPSTCTSLNDHFDLFDRKEQKQQFLKKYEGVILKSLGKEHTKSCLDRMKK